MRYVVALAAVAAAATALVAGFNAAVDPYGIAQGRWYRLRPPAHDPLADEMPDGGLTARVHAAARSRAPILLLGTSRTMVGFGTDEARVFNAGKQAGSLRDLESIMEAAAARPVPPRVYIVEAPPLRPADPENDRFHGPGWPPPVDLYLSPLTTRMSARLAIRAWRGAGGAGRGDFGRTVDGGGGVAEGAVAALRADALRQAEVGRSAAFRAGIARLVGLCARSRAALVVHEPPLSPSAAADLAAAGRERAAILAEAVRDAGRGSACRVAFLDLSDGRLLGPRALDPGRWLDHLHFDPVLGQAILEQALRRAAEAQL